MGSPQTANQFWQFLWYFIVFTQPADLGSFHCTFLVKKSLRQNIFVYLVYKLVNMNRAWLWVCLWFRVQLIFLWSSSGFQTYFLLGCFDGTFQQSSKMLWIIPWSAVWKKVHSKFKIANFTSAIKIPDKSWSLSDDKELLRNPLE